MSNLEAHPAEIDCQTEAENADPDHDGSLRVEVLAARDVPLGGPRAMTAVSYTHLTLPTKRIV